MFLAFTRRGGSKFKSKFKFKGYVCVRGGGGLKTLGLGLRGVSFFFFGYGRVSSPVNVMSFHTDI